MKTTIKEGDLVKAFTNEEVKSITHCANCYCTMNSGVARAIREVYPSAYKADCDTVRGDKEKLGHMSYCLIPNKGYIFNVYGQYNFGYDGKQYLEYWALQQGLEIVRNFMIINNIETLGIPYLMGCCRAGGKWEEVEKIINETFEKTQLEIFIYKYDKS